MVCHLRMQMWGWHTKNFSLTIFVSVCMFVYLILGCLFHIINSNNFLYYSFRRWHTQRCDEILRQEQKKQQQTFVQFNQLVPSTPKFTQKQFISNKSPKTNTFLDYEHFFKLGLTCRLLYILYFCLSKYHINRKCTLTENLCRSVL